MARVPVDMTPPVKKALEYYHSNIKHKLTEEDHGKFVAIDAHTGNWMLSDSQDVILDMHDRIPGAHPVLLQYPYISSGRLSFRQSLSYR